jgi:hypothetical protein
VSGKYKVIRLPNGSTIGEHRYVMEKHLGRELSSDEIVHHIDEDRSNNDLSNLQIMTREEHARLHRTGTILTCEEKQHKSLMNKGKARPDRRMFTDEQVREMRRLHEEEGLSYSEIGRMYDVYRHTIRSIVLRFTYVDVA